MDSGCALFFISDTIILGCNRSISLGNWEKESAGGQEGLYLVTLGDGLTSYFIIGFNIFLACQTHFVQPELLVGDATEVQFSDCVLFIFEQSVIVAVDTLCS